MIPHLPLHLYLSDIRYPNIKIPDNLGEERYIWGPGFKGGSLHHSEKGMVESMVVGGCGSNTVHPWQTREHKAGGMQQE